MIYELFRGSLEDFLPVRRHPKHYMRREVIYEPAPWALCYVHTGIVRTFHHAGGRVIHHDLFPKGECFGEACLFPPPHPETAVAQTPATVSFWTRDEFLELAWQRHLIDALLQHQAARQRRMIERLERDETLKVEDRLFAALVDTAQRIGHFDGTSATMPWIAHDVLASMIGSSRELVSHNLNHFRRQGFLKYSRREIVLCSTTRHHDVAA